MEPRLTVQSKIGRYARGMDRLDLIADNFSALRQAELLTIAAALARAREPHSDLLAGMRLALERRDIPLDSLPALVRDVLTRVRIARAA